MPPITMPLSATVVHTPKAPPQLAEEARRAWPNLRVLFTSGYSEGAFDDDDGLAAGVHLLPKPYARDELLHQVRIALDER